MSLASELRSLSSAANGLVTLCFTDVEDSTPLLERMPERYAELLGVHNRLLRTAFSDYGGTELATDGDGFFVSFESPIMAIRAAVAAQTAFLDQVWPNAASMRVRIGLHTGAPVWTTEGYVGLDIHRAARVKSAAHGGQVLVSRQTHDLTVEQLPPDYEFVDLGTHRLKGLSEPERLFQVVAPRLPRHFPPPNTILERIGSLPIQPTSLLGRELELSELHRVLSRHDMRLITLTGPGGAGKTRLAVEAAATVALQFRAGAAFVPLSSAATSDEVLAAIARTLEVPSTDNILDALIRHLGDMQVLLVLDNFEHVLGAGMDVAEILAACRGLKILATSREPLHLRGEYEFPVSTLPVPNSAHVSFSEAATSPAVRLFVERAAAVRPGFVLTEANALSIAQICAKCDGLPLAIELVAARSRLLSPSVLLARLRDPLAVAAHGPRDLPERQQSLRATIAWSYDLLPADQQITFRHLAVFRGEFSYEAAESVLPESFDRGSLFDCLEGLAAKNLLRFVEGMDGPRFTLLETIREFGLEQLDACTETADARTRHLDYLRTWASGSGAAGQVAPELAALDSQFDDLRSALGWSLGSPDLAQRGLSLAVSLGLYFWQSATLEGTEWIERLLIAAGPASSSLRARAHYWLAFLGMQTRRPEEVTSIAEECVRLANMGHPLSTTRIMALNILGEALIYTGQYDRARVMCDAAVSAARETANPRLIGMTLFPSGILASRRNDPSYARATWEESCGHFRAVDDELLLSAPLCALAATALNEGDRRLAHDLVGECLRAVRRCRDLPQLVRVLPLLGRLHLHDDADREAAACLLEALRTAAECGLTPRIGQSLFGAAELCVNRGWWESAVVLTAAIRALGDGPDFVDTDLREVARIESFARSRLSIEAAEDAGRRGAGLSRAEAATFALETVSASHTPTAVADV